MVGAVLITLVVAAIAAILIGAIVTSGPSHPDAREDAPASTFAPPVTQIGPTTPSTAAPTTTLPPAPPTTAQQTTPRPRTAPPTTPPQRSAPPTVTAAGVGPLTPLRIAAASHQDTYDRSAFGAGWTDANGDCRNTRAEILIAESLVPVTMSSTGCTVAYGRWVDRWSGTVTTTAHALDIDHTVPLANAWRSGAWSWTSARRVAYANDLADNGHLIAIPASENRTKGDSGPEEWRPPVRADWCDYAVNWTHIKAKWGLTATPDEWAALETMAATC